MKYCNRCRKMCPLENFDLCKNKKRLRSVCTKHLCPHGKYGWTCGQCRPYADVAHTLRSRAATVTASVSPVRDGLGGLAPLGCSLEEFVAHIEQQFRPGMCWQNRGKVWEIDHRVPLLGKIDGRRPTLEEVRQRLHWSNVQPLYCWENRAKGCKMPPELAVTQGGEAQP